MIEKRRPRLDRERHLQPLGGQHVVRQHHLGPQIQRLVQRVAPAKLIAIQPIEPVRVRAAIAHTLANDLTIIAPYHQGRPLPDGRWSSATMPSLVMAGGKSPAYMQNGMRALAAALPNAQHLTLAGQTHMIKDAVLAPELARFFGLAPAAAGAKQ